MRLHMGLQQGEQHRTWKDGIGIVLRQNKTPAWQAGVLGTILSTGDCQECKTKLRPF